ncbi:hypothetical protein [Pyrococcus yayanosii]|uniref:HEAT repeat domain-containing protein n=1 Tax=Pyrococcus yayanosii (strain CH1 / JCM 16557) TaxID=529709 RepID=F8AJ55_PYRYC|nr:hypothetical protein [Pyrococcus yayanosii]AEH24854.1 hypothetical protein PYCH_11740 [Pyrococcus yayanosii CH1]
MTLFSFRPDKRKIKKMLEENKVNEVIEKAVKDKKILDILFELLDDENPGTAGDAILVLTTIISEKPEVIGKVLTEEKALRVLKLISARNPYVREGAMVFTMNAIRKYRPVYEGMRDKIVAEIGKLLEEGDKNQRGFAILLAKELKLGELKDKVEALVDVKDKVMLPFEGYKWVPLGQIAEKALKEL